ncbi:MAG: hypothetical protein Mars2KO_19360 [Maribacter sp.]
MQKYISAILIYLYCQTLTLAQKTDTALLKEVNTIFKTYDNLKTPGVAVGFIQNGELIFSKGYGMADLEHNIPINTKSVFSLASVSKQFTVFAVLLLEEQGRLSLDDDIKKYLPHFPNYNKIITLRQLAAHTSGLKSHGHLLGQKGYTPDNVITKNDVLNVIYKQDALNFKPGEEFNYSNSGYVLLAEIVEKVSGKPFSIYLEEQIFSPLEMSDSFVMDDYHKIVINRANSYEIDNGTYVNAPANYSYYGSTGLYSTLLDLSKWALNFANPKIGSQSTFEKMNTLSQLNSGNTFGYALGQFVDNYNGLEYIHHAGGEAGYRAFLGRFPETNSAVLLLSNNSAIDAQGLALQVVNIFLKKKFKLTNKTSSVDQRQFKKVKLSREYLEKYSGLYLNQKTYITRNIFVRNDTLIYARPEQNNRETPLYPLEKESTFQLGDYPDLKIEFSTKINEKYMRVLENNQIVDFYEPYSPKVYKAKELEYFTGSYYSKNLDTTYELSVINGNLTITHPKLGEIRLSSIKKDGFLASSWQFRFLEFERNAQDEITGFAITSDRVRNTRFQKLK